MNNRKWRSASAATPPVPEATPSIGYPKDGVPSTATPPTIPGAYWHHQIGEELRAVIEGAGLTPDDTDLTQLRQAIQAMIVGAQKAVIINGVTFEASVADGEAVRWDSANSRFDEAIADGTSNNRAVGIADVTNSRVYLYGECPLFSGLTPGSRYYLDASTAGAITATAPADAVQIGIAKSATVLWVDVDTQPQQGTVPRNLCAMTIGNNGTNPNTQIDFMAGQASDSTNTYLMSLAATMTKTLQSSGAFAAGSGNNGLFSGARANSTWYHCFLIRKSADGSIDAGFDTSVSAANIPSGYTAYRRVGSIKTDGSGNILGFSQAGDEFLWNSPVQDVNASGIATGSTLYAINVPPDVVVEAIVQGAANSSAGAAAFHLNRPGANDVASYVCPTAQMTATNVATTFGRCHVRTNTSRQIQFNTSQSSSSLSLGAYGWIDARGRHS